MRLGVPLHRKLTFPAHEIVEAQWVAERRARECFVTEQPPYSILVRRIEQDVLPMCQKYGMGVLSWSPLAGGWLSGAFGAGKENTSRRSAMLPHHYDMTVPGNQQKLDAVTALEKVAADAGLSLLQLALGFVLEHPAITSPIIGPRTMEHLEGQVAALELRLEPDILDRIDEIVPPGTDLNATDVELGPAAMRRTASCGADPADQFGNRSRPPPTPECSRDGSDQFPRLTGNSSMGTLGPMVSWGELAQARPDLVEGGRQLLYRHGVGLAFIATVRRCTAATPVLPPRHRCAALRLHHPLAQATGPASGRALRGPFLPDADQ